MAVLSASRTELRAYNSADVLKQVDEVVERFTNAVEDVLSIHVQFIAAVDTRWRYSVFNRLTFVGSGPQGQQIWTMRVDDAALVLVADASAAGFPQAGRPAGRDDQRPDPDDQDVRTACLCQRSSARGWRRSRIPVQGRQDRGKRHLEAQPAA